MTDRARALAMTAFLASFSQTGNLAAAARTANIDRSTVYTWRETDPSFAARYQLAEEEAADYLRAAAFRRAVRGYPEFVVSMGRVVMDPNDATQPLLQTRYSDALLMALLKARVPEFRDTTKVEVSGTLRSEVVFVLPQLDDTPPELPPGLVLDAES